MQDKKLISLKELSYWSKKFNCSPTAIRIAKILVGNKAKDVEEWIKTNRDKDVLLKWEIIWKEVNKC